MIIRLGLNYAAHLAGGIAVGALAVVALHLARKADLTGNRRDYQDDGARQPLTGG